MGTTEISKILINNYPEYLSAEQIRTKTDLSRSNVYRSLKILKKYNDVEIKVLWGETRTSTWKTLYRQEE